MKSIRVSILWFATVAFLVSPLIQNSLEAHGRRAPGSIASPRASGVVVAADYRPLFLSELPGVARS